MFQFLFFSRSGGDNRRRLHGRLRPAAEEREPTRGGHLPHGAGHPVLHGHLPAAPSARHPGVDTHRRSLR